MAPVNATDESVAWTMELLMSVHMAAIDGSKQASTRHWCQRRPAAGATLTSDSSVADHRRGKVRPRVELRAVPAIGGTRATCMWLMLYGANSE